MSVDRNKSLKKLASNTTEVFSGRSRTPDEDKELELSILEEVFDKFDAIKNQPFLYNLAEGIVEDREKRATNAEDRLRYQIRPIFNPMFNTVDKYLLAHKEEWKSKKINIRKYAKTAKLILLTSYPA